jgi:hypothetical protein
MSAAILLIVMCVSWLNVAVSTTALSNVINEAVNPERRLALGREKAVYSLPILHSHTCIRYIVRIQYWQDADDFATLASVYSRNQH